MNRAVLSDAQSERIEPLLPVKPGDPGRRGVISGMLNLSRNLGLITGASVMGAVFTLASAAIDITTARPETVATGMRITFAVAAILIVIALAIAAVSHAFSWRAVPPNPEQEDGRGLKKVLRD